MLAAEKKLEPPRVGEREVGLSIKPSDRIAALDAECMRFAAFRIAVRRMVPPCPSVWYLLLLTHACSLALKRVHFRNCDRWQTEKLSRGRMANGTFSDVGTHARLECCGASPPFVNDCNQRTRG
ncbi:uncharacterized protein LACBIDRAFT_308079 [Laccaria bicolor S238N-H82]|uniref:Predicted protein n=1 Tax=Laccaria bicolor (strain S238N-H82 / ATCC MYA-4686) TaxID=486041 RepID=B0DRL1_LACBS|nr:uncharacterized protein LACBIDRAFT_308079 [Laccaria bicolor S238N-H82]EDR02890.1 predicted protein [Laccaria bicolor S238N-H82]|eukprot:XP_001886600.1 predicted protein [Laccaria bicolor S238N-H82]